MDAVKASTDTVSRSIRLAADGLALAGQLFLPHPAPERPAPAVILCHGLPRGGPPDPQDPGYPGLARRLAGAGFVVLIFNLRGTGESQGNFDLAGWGRDFTAAVDHLWEAPEVDRRRIYAVGFSMGATVVVCRSAQDGRVGGIAACAAPAAGMGADPQRLRGLLERGRQIGIIRDPSFPPSFEEWAKGFRDSSPSRWVDKIAPRPLLILHGDRDEVIPVENAPQLFGLAVEPKELAILPRAGHQLRREEAAVAALLGWLLKVSHHGSRGARP